jgi:hypothetical protein
LGEFVAGVVDGRADGGGVRGAVDANHTAGQVDFDTGDSR